MKKIICMLMALLLAVSLCACGEKTEDEKASKDESSTTPPVIGIADETVDPTVVRDGYDKALAYINSELNTKGMTESDQDDDGGQSLYHYWLYDHETENADFPTEITVSGQKIVIDTTTAKDLIDAGLKLETTEETIEPGVIYSFQIVEGQNRFMNVGAANNTDKAAKGETIPITEIITTGGESSIPFTYNGITEGADLKTLLDTFGAPNLGATLCSDSMGVNITLDYFSEKTENDVRTYDQLTLNLKYDAEKDVATLLNLQLIRSLFEAEQEQ